MEHLTVSEAAERLGISEGAVRKRLQRGTLAHGKRSDGRVYVVMDANLTVEEDTDTEPSDGGNQNPPPSWWDYAAGVSALVIVFGGLIYALGLFVLFAPIAMTYTRDVSAAWHATFLVPRAVVAGLGVWRLVAFPLSAGTLIFIICYVAAPFALRLSLRFPERWMAGIFWIVTSAPVLLLIIGYASWRIATGPSPLAQAPYLTIVVLVLALISVPEFTAFLMRRRLRQATFGDFFGTALLVVGLIFMLFIAYQVWHSRILPRVPDLEKPGVTRDALIQAVIVIGAGTTVDVAAGRATSRILSGESEDRFLVILLSFLTISAAAFIAAFMLAIPSNPPLPKVVIDVKERKENTTGSLLTHTEGFWYLFEDRDGQPGRRLTAIPDDEVRTAWVSKSPAR